MKPPFGVRDVRGAQANPHSVRESAYDALQEIGKISTIRRNAMIALRGVIHVACFHHSCFIVGVCRCLLQDVDEWGHATSFFCAGGVAREGAQRKK